jgi:hypothetical protein
MCFQLVLSEWREVPTDPNLLSRAQIDLRETEPVAQSVTAGVHISSKVLTRW